MNKHKCRVCLGEAAGNYHPKCAREFFGTSLPLRLDISQEDINSLAKKAIAKSLAVTGVQRKLSLDIEKRREEGSRFTMLGVGGNFILKPPTSEYPSLPEIEHANMRLAHQFGIETVPHALIELKSGELAYITRRIDRTKGGKLHMEDMCQLLGRLTEDKYRSSMERVGKAIKKHSDLPGLDLGKFFELACFSFLTGNADMHMKNFSLIRKRALWQLAPAYDLVATRLVISAKADPEEMALTLNGKKSNFKHRDFLEFGANLGLRDKQVSNFMERMESRLEGALEVIADSFLNGAIKEEFTALMQRRYKRIF